MIFKNIYILVPVYNESKYIENFIQDLYKEIKNLPEIKKVVFIDDGSTDNTRQQVEQATNKYKNITLVGHSVNKGKGEAMKTGLAFAKTDAEAVIFMDGDNQHSPKYLKPFIEKLKKFPIVFGYRHLSKDAPFVRRTGNKIAGFIIHNLFHIKRRDLLCGFMAFRKDVFDRLSWTSKGYGVEAELSAVVGRRKIPFSEVFIPTIYLDRKKGVTIKNVFFILLTLPKWYFTVKT